MSRAMRSSGGRRGRLPLRGQEGSYRGNMFCNSAVVTPMKLAWASDRVNNPYTTLRILPTYSPDDPSEFDPWRIGGGLDDLTDFCVNMMAVRAFGNPAVTMLLYNPWENEHYVVENNPAHMIYSALNNAIDAGEERPGWGKLLKGARGRGAMITRPKPIMFCQAIVYEQAGKVKTPPVGGTKRDNMPLIDLGASAGKELMQLLDTEREDWDKVDANDLQARFLYNNPVELDGGYFFRFFPLGHDPRKKDATQESEAFSGAGIGADVQPTTQSGRRGRDDDDDGPRGFGVYALRRFHGASPNFATHEEFLKTRVRPWEEVLLFPSDEEQAEILSGRVPADVLEYAWGDNPEFLRFVKNAVSANIPYEGEELPSRQQDAAHDDYEDDEEVVPSGGRYARRGAAVREDTSGIGSDLQDEEVLPAAGRSRRQSKPDEVTAALEDMGGDDDVPPPPAARTSRPSRPSAEAGPAAAPARPTSTARPTASAPPRPTAPAAAPPSAAASALERMKQAQRATRAT